VYGIKYEVGDKPKSDLYRDFLPLLNSGQVELLDSDRLVNQIVSLERKTARGGKDSIDHPPGGMDDLANAVAGVCTSGVKKKRGGVWGVCYLGRDKGRPPLSQIANPHLVLAHEERKRARKRPKLDDYTDAVLSGRARILGKD
jgi:hypothetical protein